MTARRAKSWILCTLSPWLLGAGASAQSYLLNDPFHRDGIVGGVDSFLVHPSAGHVLFRATARREGAGDLYHAPLDGSGPQVPIVAVAPGRYVGNDYAFRDDGRWVVFRANLVHQEIFELYSHEVGTVGYTKLSGAQPPGGQVESFAIAPDGLRVVYLGWTPQGGQLFTVPIDGRAPATLLDTEVESFVGSSPDDRVVYQKSLLGAGQLYSVPADGGAPALRLATSGFTGSKVSSTGRVVFFDSDHRNLFSVPSDGSAQPVQLNPPLAGGRRVQSFLVSPDGARVVYQADQDTYLRFEIYSVPADGGPALKLNLPIAAGESVVTPLASPDSHRVIYQRIRSSGTELFSTPIDDGSGGSGSILLDSTARTLNAYLTLSISPDSRHLVYRSTIYYLESVAIDGSSGPILLNVPGDRVERIAIGPDSSSVLFTQRASSGERLLAVPILRQSEPVLLNDSVGSFGFSADGARAVFIGPPPQELFSVRLDGSQRAQLSTLHARGTTADVGSHGSLQAFAFDGTGEHVVYSADANVDEAFELFSTRADGSSAALPISGLADVRTPSISPDGRWVVYRSIPPTNYTGGELYSAPVDGSRAPVQLSVSSTGTLAGRFAISADSARVVYVRGTVLYSVPIAGGASLPLDDGQDYSPHLAITPDARRVVYTHDQALRSAAIDGSAPPVQLDPDPSNFLQLTPDGVRVLYLVVTPTRVFSARSVPVDGSASPFVIHQPTGELQSLTLSPDGAWAVFTTNPPSSSEEELFSRRIDGSSALLHLNGATALLGGVEALEISPDSRRVVFSAAQVVRGKVELYSVPIDATAEPTAIDGLDDSATVNHFAISPDVTRVVYSADLVRNDWNDSFQLFSVPIAGGSAPAMLSRSTVGSLLQTIPTLAWSAFQEFQITRDSSSVLFLADGRTRSVFELFQVPIDGSLEPLPVNPPLVTPGCRVFQLSPDGRRVVYQANREYEATELFGSVLPDVPQQRHASRR